VNGTINKASVPLFVGKGNTDKLMGIFLVNAINGAYDETKIFNSALTAATISSSYSAGLASVTTTGEQAIAVSASRFQNDLQRPSYHAMPPANWTNEPHGLVYYNGSYHMFYQRTPNGPFKTLMHWGHMTSSDLVNWTNTKDAMWPQLLTSSTSGYDMKGIWSGDVVVQNGTAHAFYTCVNHTGPYNPGIAHATSSDTGFKSWTKIGPVIDRQFVNDFRDPYLFKDGSTWVMIIGAAVSGSGGLDCYTSTDLNTWTHKTSFCTVPYSSMDIGSVIWEMPVFESLGNGKYILIVNPIGGQVGKYGPKYTRAVYWVGSYTNGQFTPDYTQPKNLDVIHGHLSPTVERNPSGQLVGIGMVDERRNSQAQLDAGWCHVFSLPRVYSLLPDNKTLGQAPAPELASLRQGQSRQTISNVSVSGNLLVATAANGKGEILAQIPSTTASKYGINVRVSPDGQETTRIYYDAVQKKVVLDKTKSTLSSTDEEKVLISQDYDEVAFGKPTTLHIYLDNSIIDVFINEKAAFSARIYPTKADSRGIQLFSEGTAVFSTVDVWSASTQNIPVTGVSLNKSTTSIAAGTTEQLSASVAPSNATNQVVTWTSSNAAIASVSSSGLVTANAVGTTTITVTTQDGAKTATCTVSVTQAPQTLVLNFETGNLSGWTVVSGNAFSAADVCTDTGWRWGGPFNQQGSWHLWSFKDGGDAQVGVLKTNNFVLGGSGQVTALVGGGNDLTNLYIALCRVSDDFVISKATGNNDEAYTQKTLNGSGYVGVSCYVKVVDSSTGGFGHLNVDNVIIPISTSSIAVSSVSLNKTATTRTIGTQETLVATVLPADATNKSVSWTSSNSSVATVNSSGLVTAVSVGTATITATTQDMGKTASCIVTVVAQSYTVLDFESGNLSGWTIFSGNAFSAADVCQDVNWGWGGPFNQQGAWHLWGFKDGGDAQVGELRSGSFTLAGDGQVTALVGGGNDINNLYVALCRVSDNLVIAKQTGVNDEAYTVKTLNGASYVGTSCYIKIVDAATGGFGHINIDNVRIPTSNPSGRVASVETKVGDENVQSRLTVFPNPATNAVTLDLGGFEGQTMIKIFDLSGKQILATEGVGGSHVIMLLDEVNIRTGVFILEVRDYKKRSIVKLLVK
jgi:beta-fructofuranosidase